MKFTLAIFTLFVVQAVGAQTKMIQQYPDSNVVWNVSSSKHTNRHVTQFSGYTFNEEQLMRMPVRNINRIASTVAGVESRAGETPIIRGAVGGTAYFIDGVRVYGALPNVLW
jgi:hypothetical protein